MIDKEKIRKPAGIMIGALLLLLFLLFIFKTPHVTIRPGRGVQITKADIFTSTSIVYRTGLSERYGGEEVSIYKNLFLLKNEGTLRFRVHYSKRDGEVELVWAKIGKTIYAVMKPRPPMRKREYMRPPEVSPTDEKYVVRVQDPEGKRFLKGAEADKIIKHTIAQAEKMLQETRTRFASEIKKAQEKSRQWQERNRSHRPGPPNNKPGMKRDAPPADPNR
jgi:hypothetical protein